ncbi:hypothetical protein BDC45DRAFT_516071 [Circinella umbellata]|nr:hypothetical protein BDC45DRAFT_516071 [Circinella umbellata]
MMTQDYYYSALSNYTDFDSIIQIFKIHAARYHDRVFIRYQTYPNSLEYKILTYGQVDNISTNLANIWKPTFLQAQPSSFSLHKVQEEENEPTATAQKKQCLVALNDDPVQSVLTLLATLKLGLIYFPLSTLDSDAAIIHLLQKTNVSCLVTSEACYNKALRCTREAMVATANMIQKNHSTKAAPNSIEIKIWNDQLDIDELANNIKVTLPSLSVTTGILESKDINSNNCNISSTENNTQKKTSPLTDNNVVINKNNSREKTFSTDIVLYMHTSGSTKFPDLIGWNTQSILYSAFVTLSQRMYDANVPFESSDILLVPILLITGPDVDFLLSAILAGSSIVVFHDNKPKPADLLAASEMFHATFLFAPPAILDQLANYIIAKEEQEQKQQAKRRGVGDGNNHYQTKITTLFKRFKFSMYFGGMLSKSTGDFLMSKGLNLQSGYGSTETGLICLSDVSKKNSHGHSIHVTSQLMQYVSFEPYDSQNESLEHKGNSKKSSKEKLYQCIIHNNYISLAKGVANRPNGDFATKDLFVMQKQLTDGSHYWSFVGRIDDAFKTSYGEKVIPTPMEKIICSEDIIRNCIIVGENREGTAVLIELDREKASAYSSKEISDKVHEAVRQGNEYALYDAIVSVPDKVYILPAEKQLPRSRKGTVVRKIANDMFKQEIELLYSFNNNIV